MSTDRRDDEVLAVLKLAQKWLANCVPVADLDGPKPLPKIARLIAKLQSGDPGVAVAPPPASECSACVAKDFQIAALQESIDGCAKKVAELVAAVRAVAPPPPLKFCSACHIQALHPDDEVCRDCSCASFYTVRVVAPPQGDKA